VRGVEGDAPLACIVRLDRQHTELRHAVSTLSLWLLAIEDRL
jgi:hypothetical protein